MAMNAVYSSVASIRATLTHYCGPSLTSVCPEYRTAEERVKRLVDGFDRDVFHDAQGQLLPFSDWPAVVTTLNVQMADQGAYSEVIAILFSILILMIS